ncbi:MAG: zinc ribbon domain-containing protein [Verrucomicrobiota bacterium]|nr:zinc ribbon domain-containing protein [Verrucomicrobiota bacterium]MDP7048704.1 zinc ribbon domain-containing protein [Verrucomicrobiota bacterium]
MSQLVPCSMCGNDLSPQATFCPKCGHPRVGKEPEASRPGGVADMSGSGLRDLMAIIEQNLEILRELAIHGSDEMKALAVALLQAQGQKVNPEQSPGENQSLETEMPPETGEASED